MNRYKNHSSPHHKEKAVHVPYHIMMFKKGRHRRAASTVAIYVTSAIASNGINAFHTVPNALLTFRHNSSSKANGNEYHSAISSRYIPAGMVATTSDVAVSGMQADDDDDDDSNNDRSSFVSKLGEFDPVLADMIQCEDRRQRVGLELIASENFASAAVREALGSCLTNKYSEGGVGKRYYGGNEYIDQIESLCMDRALELYGLDAEEWGVNVQPYSGSPANFAVYTALLNPHDRIMGLDLPSGGHLTHGFQTPKRKVSATSVYFESMPYVVSSETGLIDYDEMELRVKMFMPKLLIAGASAYPREWDYARMRKIADSVGAYLLVDMAHISGLVAGRVAESPFSYADVVTSTTHKTLRGPRSGMIFAKRSLMEKINSAVFPSLQGGPHNHQIAGLAVALKEANSDEFRSYASSVISNAKALADGLINRGHVIITGGTDNHLLLWNVRPHGLTGSKVEKVLDMVSITTNKNSIPGDTSAINPGGVRLGTPALTSRGLDEDDFDRVAEFLHQGSEIAIEVQNIAELELKHKQESGDEEALKKEKVLLKDFVGVLKSNESIRERVESLKSDVEEFAIKFAMPGDK
uniref:Serine hydroxymethyltransferase n=1 Tax=Helicotheca tamesis TaxID=374047 RepID=A0A7S2N4Q3_9STRA|mmetsp:Transcript_9701/g.13588  ORF Transcript_9701/g.13588 Transcript_9701/m.13588 type:complete len:582 (+) Transcript_9701:28-1773(+)